LRVSSVTSLAPGHRPKPASSQARQRLCIDGPAARPGLAGRINGVVHPDDLGLGLHVARLARRGTPLDQLSFTGSSAKGPRAPISHARERRRTSGFGGRRRTG